MPPWLAIPTFTKGESNISIQLQIGNKAALSHLLEIGGGNCKKHLLVISKSMVMPLSKTNLNNCIIYSQQSKCKCWLGISISSRHKVIKVSHMEDFSKSLKWKESQLVLSGLYSFQEGKFQQLIRNCPGVRGLAVVVRQNLIHFKQP